MFKKPGSLRKTISLLLCFCFFSQQVGFAQIAGVLNLSGYLNQMQGNTVIDKYRPVHLRFFSYDNINDQFKVFLDKGDELNSQKNQDRYLEEQTKKLLNYFLIGVTLPNESFWVNLRPDSESNIIDSDLARTDIGKILLEADVQLKKDTAKFTSPETPEGKLYWNKLYEKAGQLYGTQNITIPTLTRPWIVPGEIIIRESEGSAYVYKATLKVMLEQDYLKDSVTYSFKDSRAKELNEYSSELIREQIIPNLTKEVNVSKRYAALRQVFYSLVLARWFKSRFTGKSGIYSSLINKKDLNGLTSKENWSKATYFNQYQESFKNGEYNLKVPVYGPNGQVIRNYFSGGVEMGFRVDGSMSSPVEGFKAGGKNLEKALLKGNMAGFQGATGMPSDITFSGINGNTPSASPAQYHDDYELARNPNLNHWRARELREALARGDNAAVRRVASEIDRFDSHRLSSRDQATLRSMKDRGSSPISLMDDKDYQRVSTLLDNFWRGINYELAAVELVKIADSPDTSKPMSTAIFGQLDKTFGGVASQLALAAAKALADRHIDKLTKVTAAEDLYYAFAKHGRQDALPILKMIADAPGVGVELNSRISATFKTVLRDHPELESLMSGSSPITTQFAASPVTEMQINQVTHRLDNEKFEQRLRALYGKSTEEVESIDPELAKIVLDYTEKGPEKNRLGWSVAKVKWLMENPDEVRNVIAEAEQIRDDGFENVIIGGMGGSGLAVQTVKTTFDTGEGLNIYSLRTTDPAVIADILQEISLNKRISLEEALKKTKIILISKSATTRETNTHKDYFEGVYRALNLHGAGIYLAKNINIVTDDGSPWTKEGKGYGRSDIQLNKRGDIGGRFTSPTTRIFLLPLALVIHKAYVENKIFKIFKRALEMNDVDIDKDIFFKLAAFLYLHATNPKKIRDKVTLLMPEELRELPLWAEQLFEESLGKKGKGVTLFYGENLPREVLRPILTNDRVFLRINLKGKKTSAKLWDHLTQNGYPVFEINAEDIDDIGGLMLGLQRTVAAIAYLWDIGFVDQPAVNGYKDGTNAVMDKFRTESQGRGKIEVPSEWKSAGFRNLKLYYEPLMRIGVVSEAELRAELGKLGASLESAPAVYAAILNILSGKPGFEAAELTSYGRMTLGLKSILEAQRSAIFTKGLKMPSKLGEGPDKNHSYQQNVEDGRDIFFSTYFMPLKIQQPSEVFPDVAKDIADALVYDDNLLRAQTIGTVESMIKNKRKVVLITANTTTKDAEKEVDEFFKQANGYLEQLGTYAAASPASEVTHVQTLKQSGVSRIGGFLDETIEEPSASPIERVLSSSPVVVDPNIFGDMDIRGHADIKLPSDAVERLGRAYGIISHEKFDGILPQGRLPRIVAGFDARESSPRIHQATVEGLKKQGIHVIDIGACTTPMLYFATRLYKADGGVMITASHLPWNVNGLKPVIRQLKSPGSDVWIMDNLPADDIQKMYTLSIEESFPEVREGVVETKNPVDDYADSIEKALNQWLPGKLRDNLSRIKLVIDYGNGSTGFLGNIFRNRLDVEVVDLYPERVSDLSSDKKPHHLADPAQMLKAGEQEAYGPLMSEVKRQNELEEQKPEGERKIVIGIAFDTDGDRVGFVDELGEPFDGNATLAALSYGALKDNPGQTVLINTRTNNSVFHFIESLNGRAVWGHTGYSKLRKDIFSEEDQGHSVAFGGEDTGHVLYPENSYFDDGSYTALKIVALIAKHNVSLSKIKSMYEPSIALKEARLKFSPADINMEDTRIKEEQGRIRTETIADVLTTFEDMAARGRNVARLEFKGDVTEVPYEITSIVNIDGPMAFFKIGNVMGKLLIRSSLHEPVFSVSIQSAMANGEPFDELSLLKANYLMASIAQEILARHPEVDKAKKFADERLVLLKSDIEAFASSPIEHEKATIKKTASSFRGEGVTSDQIRGIITGLGKKSSSESVLANLDPRIREALNNVGYQVFEYKNPVVAYPDGRGTSIARNHGVAKANEASLSELRMAIPFLEQVAQKMDNGLTVAGSPISDGLINSAVTTFALSQSKRDRRSIEAALKESTIAGINAVISVLKANKAKLGADSLSIINQIYKWEEIRNIVLGQQNTPTVNGAASAASSPATPDSVTRYLREQKRMQDDWDLRQGKLRGDSSVRDKEESDSSGWTEDMRRAWRESHYGKDKPPYDDVKDDASSPATVTPNMKNKASSPIRKPFVGGNWKMAKGTKDEARRLLLDLADQLYETGNVETVIAPSFIHIPIVSDALQELTQEGKITAGTIKIAAQNMYAEEEGAYTGGTSAKQLEDFGVTHVILGHSEARRNEAKESTGESNRNVNKKVTTAFQYQLTPIVCVGESYTERTEGREKEIVGQMVQESLAGISQEDAEKVVIAYEPVWAIGTGKSATAEQAEEMHSFIRGILTEMFTAEIAAKIRILYGGSVTTDNISSFIAQPDIDGALVGGASLKADSFSSIVKVVFTASSPALERQSPAGDLGGIDFSSMNIIIQPMGRFSMLKFDLPKISNIESFNLDDEMQSIRSMVKSGVIPSAQRLKEYIAACYQKKELKNRAEDLIVCIADICRLEEEEVCETSPDLKEALVIVDMI